MKLAFIDALRGLAILGVLMVHCSHYGTNEFLPVVVQAVIAHGAHGVQLFFVASAFTLFLALENRKGTASGTWLNFFARRFFRIAPMYYIGICYYLWQDGFGSRYWLADAEGVTTANILSNVFFVHGFNPYWITSIVPGGWSVAVEMFFYCLIPLLFLKIKNTQQAFVFLLATLALSISLRFLLNRTVLIESERLWHEYLNLYLPSQLPVFALGILFYFIVKNNGRLSVPPSLVFLSALILIAQFSGIRLLPTHFLFGIAFVVLGVALSRYEFKIFVNPVLIHIGKVSFSVYLVHFAVLFWLEKFDAADYLTVTDPQGAIINYGIRLMVVTLLSVLIGSVFYNLIELPMQRLGRKVITKLTSATQRLGAPDVYPQTSVTTSHPFEEK